MRIKNPESSSKLMPPRRVTVQLDDRSTLQSVEYPNSSAVLDMCADLAREAQTYIGMNVAGKSDQLTLAMLWERNGMRFLGDHYSSPASGGGGLVEGHRVFHVREDGSMGNLKRVTLNRIQPGVISAWANQTAAQHVIRFIPQQSADRPRVWLTKQGGRKMEPLVAAAIAEAEANSLVAEESGQPPMPPSPLATLTPEQVLGDEDGPTQRLDEEQSALVRTMLLDGTLTSDDALLVNDDFLARQGQKVFDNRWRRANGDCRVVINSLLCGVFGHAPMRLQYHSKGPKAGDFTLENVHILNVWIDPTHETIDQSDYLGFEYLLSFDEAIATMPRARRALERASQRGAFDAKGQRYGSVWHKVDFQRPMVRVRVVWTRHQEIPLSIKEALASGRVIEQMEPVFNNDDGAEVLDRETGEQLMQGSKQYLTVPQVDGGEDDYEFEGLDAVEPGEEQQPEPTKPGMTNWPTKIGLRETVTLPDANYVVRDGECPYLDIPFGWNINIPILYSPFGQGVPQIVEDVQQQINRLLTIFGNYMGLFAYPVRYWKATVLQGLVSRGVQLGIAPGQNIPIADEDYDELIRQGRMNMESTVAIMPPLMMDILQMLMREMDRVMGHQDAVQGVAPSGVKSGVGIQALQQAAAGPLAARARFTEYMVERVAKIMMDGIVRWVPDEVWEKILELPKPVIADMRELMAEREFNFYCAVATGRGTNEERQEARAIELYAAGKPGRLMARRTAMEKISIVNPDDEEKRIDDEDDKAMRRAMGIQAEAGGAPVAAGAGPPPLQ